MSNSLSRQLLLVAVRSHLCPLSRKAEAEALDLPVERRQVAPPAAERPGPQRALPMPVRREQAQRLPAA